MPRQFLVTPRISLAILTAVLGCAPTQPRFVEPAWGHTPAPYAIEVTEITLEVRRCPPTGPHCADQQFVFTRDGGATQAFAHSGRIDSAFTGRIDSLTFIQLASFLRDQRFFGSSSSGGHELTAVRSFVVSSATLCRRATASYASFEGEPSPPTVPARLLGAAAQVTWSRYRGPRRGLLPTAP